MYPTRTIQTVAALQMMQTTMQHAKASKAATRGSKRPAQLRVLMASVLRRVRVSGLLQLYTVKPKQPQFRAGNHRVRYAPMQQPF
eukprot:6208475-Pleurochrysis_carterae.AAC.5